MGRQARRLGDPHQAGTPEPRARASGASREAEGARVTGQEPRRWEARRRARVGVAVLGRGAEPGFLGKDPGKCPIVAREGVGGSFPLNCN